MIDKGLDTSIFEFWIRCSYANVEGFGLVAWSSLGFFESFGLGASTLKLAFNMILMFFFILFCASLFFGCVALLIEAIFFPLSENLGYLQLKTKAPRKGLRLYGQLLRRDGCLVLLLF